MKQQKNISANLFNSGDGNYYFYKNPFTIHIFVGEEKIEFICHFNNVVDAFSSLTPVQDVENFIVKEISNYVERKINQMYVDFEIERN
jgi:hypothetical protein